MIKQIEKLIQYTQKINLADQLSDDDLLKLGDKVVQEFMIDESSRSDWVKKSESAMDMAMQTMEEKTFPWPGASNVKTPLLSEAALQFNARCYPAVIQSGNMVKGKVTGKDETGDKLARAERVAAHMNYQLTEEMPEWEEDVDRMLLALPIEGCEFKKVYFDKVKGRNVSEWIRPKNFIVNNTTRSLDDCPRATHEIYKYPNDISAMQRAGIYRDVDLNIDNDDNEEEKQQCLLEQYRLMDLDEDGVKEPYIVLVHKESKKVLRIKANWEATDIIVSDGAEVFPAFERNGVNVYPEQRTLNAKKLISINKYQYFVKYSFLPSADGSFYDIGYGQLVTPLVHAIDSILNQLIDAGTLANAPPGLIAEGMKILNSASGSGEIRFKPGEWKKVRAGSASKIADSIFQFQFPGPSTVLYTLLSGLIDQVKTITSTSDIMLGAASGPNEPVGTTMARLDQAMKVFNAVYKRLYRSFNKEFKLLYNLNSIYLQPKQYFRVVDSPEPLEIQIMDYQGDSTDIQPVADPSVATTQQRVAKSQLLMQIPVPNENEKIKRVLEAADIEGIDKLMEQPPQQPDPKMLELSAKMQKMAEDTNKVAAEAEKTVAETEKIHADILTSFEKIDLERFKEGMSQMEKLDERIRSGIMEAISGDQINPQNPAMEQGAMPSVPMPGQGEPLPNAGPQGME